MSNRKRVTLTFEIDDHYGYNDEAFMRRDFLQELVCCVNDPYEDTFVMKVEDADEPHEMTAKELYSAYQQMCKEYNPKSPPVRCHECPLYVNCPRIGEALRMVMVCSPHIEKWAKEHPEERNEE